MTGERAKLGVPPGTCLVSCKDSHAVSNRTDSKLNTSRARRLCMVWAMSCMDGGRMGRSRTWVLQKCIRRFGILLFSKFLMK
jgi:hypothetical protein